MKIGLKELSLALASAGVFALHGCGGGGGTAATATPTATPTLSAALNDAPVKGVCYLAQPSGLHGSTDVDGNYNFQSGDSVSFWIDVSGSGCGTTPANSTSTTGIALGAATPTGSGQQTFVLSLSAGPQVAETLQALNHGTTGAMDVSGLTLANTSTVSSINNYLATNGTSQSTSTAVATLFQTAQSSATVGGTTITPALVVNPATFQADVVGALATTISSRLGTAPTSVTIPANRIVFAVNSGTFNRTGSCGTTGNTIPFTEGHITYFDGSGNGIKIRPMQQTGTVNIGNFAGTVETNDQLHFTYSISSNVVSKSTNIYSFTVSGAAGIQIGTAADTTTIKYDDGHGAFYSGSYTKQFTAGTNSGCSDVGTYSGSNVRLTPLSLSMLAGKKVTISAPGCAGGTVTLTYNAAGTSVTSTCGSGVETLAASTNVPGVLIKTSPLATSGNDGSILYMGLDGPAVAAGSALVFVTESNGLLGGTVDYPNWGRMQILSVQ